MEVLLTEDGVALESARLRAHLADLVRRVKMNGPWIAAMVVARGRFLVTQEPDFDRLEGKLGLGRVRGWPKEWPACMAAPDEPRCPDLLDPIPGLWRLPGRLTRGAAVDGGVER